MKLLFPFVVVMASVTLFGCATPRNQAIPGNVYSMMTVGRAIVAEKYSRKEDRLMFERVSFPYAPLLTNNADYFVTFIDGDTYLNEVVGTNEVTEFETISVFVKPDGSLDPNGFSKHQSTRPAKPPRKPRPQSTNVVTKLPDMDYVQLSREALKKEIDQEKINRLIPFSCSVFYGKDGDPDSGIKSIWVNLFDPRDIELGPNEHNDFVSGFSVMVKPDGTALFRGRGRFGSSRFRQIAELLNPASVPASDTP